jgi:hypothetical protein
MAELSVLAVVVDVAVPVLGVAQMTLGEAGVCPRSWQRWRYWPCLEAQCYCVY